ncbi:hypothetical protein JCM21142_41493 [Saccharicrinis fermentans DSM 9555 = JCM 21142]|uniref:Fibronectin type-III domain-containing protein n=1 Tax=Saccharicrinis fermentans DSM 9555 = JCM 21142 TaxID=869213 RepID=W7Y5K1_9BACT|nr:hypothetical protein JCM21142_41493 [Saccharicrinis fermentans DSM 9555 = JCM 21142]
MPVLFIGKRNGTEVKRQEIEVTPTDISGGVGGWATATFSTDWNSLNIDELEVQSVGATNYVALDDMSLVIKNAPIAATVTAVSASSVTSSSVSVGGVVSGDGGGNVTERGVVYAQTSVNSNPAVGGTGVTKVSIGSGLGSYSTMLESLSANTSYTFNVYAINENGTSYGSAQEFTTKMVQTISFGTLPDVVYGDVDFSPGASVSSGLVVSYSTSDVSVATIVDGKVHIVGAGSCTIYADQAGNDSYGPAPQMEQSLTVGKAALTATADNQSKVYGAENPELTISYSGFVAGDTEADLESVPDILSLVSVSTPPGEYIIVIGDGSDDNYNFSYVDGLFTIMKGTLTVTAHDKEKSVGDENPELTYEISGFVSADDLTDLETLPTISCDATAASVAGTYDIVVDNAMDPNYNFVYENGTLTVQLSTDVNDIGSTQYAVWPNPTRGIIHVSGANAGSKYKVFGVTGNIVMDGEMESSQIDLSDLANGVYILVVDQFKVKIVKK